MLSQNKKIMDIDERPKGREGIKEMLERMEKIIDYPETAPQKVNCDKGKNSAHSAVNDRYIQERFLVKNVL